MTSLLGVLGLTGGSQAWLVLALDSAFKGMVIFGIATAVAVALRRASAAARHRVWALAILGVLFQPALSCFLPGWRVSVLPLPVVNASDHVTKVHGYHSGRFRARVDANAIASGRNGVELPAVGVTMPGMPRGAPTFGRWPVWGLGLWAIGAAVVSGRLFIGLAVTCSKGRKARIVSNREWKAIVDDAALAYGIRRPISLRLTGAGTMPATWGFIRPVVALPAEAADWPAERLRCVLLHELAHVSRYDFLTHVLARVVCALHWFNPLAWLADRQLSADCEGASDELVLNAGIKRSDYAAHLVAILTGVQRERHRRIGALAMARKRGLERRVLAILNETVPRPALSLRRSTMMSLSAICVFLLLAVVRLDARAHDVPKLDRLPKGMTVEVLSVSTHPSTTTTWWRPDGSVLTDAPCDPAVERSEFAGASVREVVARITGLPEGATLRWHPTQCTSRGCAEPRKDGKPRPELQRVIAHFSSDAKTCVVHFDLAVGPWTIEQAHKGGIGIEKAGRSFFFGRPHETRRGTAIAIAHNITDRDVRVTAIDKDGKTRHPVSSSWGSAGHLVMFDVEFDVPPTGLSEYQLESRPVGRFEIKDVALQPR